MKISWRLLLLTVVSCAWSYADEKAYPMDRRFFEPVDPPETAHIAWAKPYALGTLRVLVVGPRQGQRETVELMQRMDIDVTAVYMTSGSQLGYPRGDRAPWMRVEGWFKDQVEDDLRAKLRSSYDVILLGGLTWTAMPPDCRYQLLKKLKEGAGLILIAVGDGGDPFLKELLNRECNENNDFVTAGLPLPWMTTLRDYPTVADLRKSLLKFCKLGDGRVVRIGWATPLISIQRKEDTPFEEYDYTLSLPIRAILWAAKREPKLIVNPASAPTLEVNGDKADAVAKVPIKNTGGIEKLDVEITKRNLADGGAVVTRREGCEFPPGESAFDVPFPQDMPRGKVWVDLICRRDGKVVTWGSAAVSVVSPSGIASLSLDDYAISCKGAVGGVLRLEGIERDMKVRLEVEDGFGRIVSRKEILTKAGTTEVRFEMPKFVPIAIMHAVHASLEEGGRTLAVAKDWFSVCDLPFDNEDYHIYAWCGQAESLFYSPLFAQQNYKAGFDLQYTRLSKPYLWAGIRNFPYIGSLREVQERPKDVPAGIRVPCINDPAWRKTLVDGMKERVPEHMRFSTIHFSLGDENYLSGADVCFCPRCNERFTRFVRTIYPSIEALNAAHKTDYKSWDDVKPMTLEQARKQGSMAPWMDHRLHMEEEWFGLYTLCINTIKGVCPGAIVGDEGNIAPTAVYSAFDLSRLCQLTQFRCPYYYRVPRDVFRSFKKKGDFTGYISGGYVGSRHDRAARFFPWISVLDGHNQLMFYVEGGQEGGFAPDGSMYPFTRTWAEQVQEIKSGIGKMLVMAEPQHDGVAILYSRTSMIAGEFSHDLERMDEAMDGFGQLLRDCRIGYRYVSYGDLAAGKVTPGEYRLLILPYAQSLSDKEVTAILNYAKAGGSVLADFEPGIMNEHGVKRDSWPLRDLFGVELTEQGDHAAKGDAEASGLGLAGPLQEATVSLRVQLAGGKAMGSLGSAPIFVIRKYGNGQGAYLNCSMTSYIPMVRERKPGQEEYLGAFLGLMRTLKVCPPTRIEPAVRGVEIMRFRRGSAEYVALVWSIDEMYRGDIKYNRDWVDEPEPRSLLLHLGREAHVYESRSGQYFGQVSTVPVALKYGVPQVFALLPHKVESLRVSTGCGVRLKAGMRLGFSVEARTSAGGGCPHFYHHELVDPDGKRVAHYAGNLFSPDGPHMGCAWARIPMAHNDKRGLWQLRVTNVATNITESFSFELTD